LEIDHLKQYLIDLEMEYLKDTDVPTSPSGGWSDQDVSHRAYQLGIELTADQTDWCVGILNTSDANVCPNFVL